MPLDVDAVTSPRYTREPLSLSLHLIEVSHISIRKSSITLRYINMSFVPKNAAKLQKFFEFNATNCKNDIKCDGFVQKTYDRCAEWREID